MKNMRKRVEVYWNFHKKIWSVRHKGKIIHHARIVMMGVSDFTVQPAGNARVRREKVKNVHAFVRGELVYSTRASVNLDMPVNDGWRKVTYDPYKNKTFVFKDTGEPIKRAETIIMDADTKSVWAFSSVG